MDREVLISAKGISKRFCRDLKRSLWYGFGDIARGIFGKSGRNELRKNEFWAVRNVSFEVRRGECLGLIGHNGAGKSTLLKMLNGLIRPDEGRIEMRGRIGSLIELGAGFNPLLSGRENVYVNGAVLGFSKEEIDRRFDDIVAFAELEKFIDMPVQNYSSGMKVRLGFAVAAQMEPDILIVDEVLAVGDLGFVLKCFNVIDKLLENTCVILVSHSMPIISRICSHIVLLDNGKQVFTGSDVSKGIDLYYAKFTQGFTTFQRRPGEIELLEISINSHTQNSIAVLNHGGDLLVQFKIKMGKQYSRAAIGFTVYDKEQRPIGILSMDESVPSRFLNEIDEQYIVISGALKASRINLSKGIYSLTLFVSEEVNTKPLLRLQSVIGFQVISKRDIWPPIEFECEWV